jgi:hypothetical protein
MKNIKKILVLVAVVAFLGSLQSCKAGGKGGCNCPKFSLENATKI